MARSSWSPWSSEARTGASVPTHLDEADFSAMHPNRNGWTPKDERHLIEAQRGKRWNSLWGSSDCSSNA